MSRQVSWVFSTYNEAGNPYLWQNLDLLIRRDSALAVVDGGSTDQTLPLLEQRGVTALSLPRSTRGQRFDLGLRQSDARDVVFVHPRTLLTEAVVARAQLLPTSHDWGAFTHRFDQAHPLLRFTSWWSNHVRGDGRGIYYLDHVLWARRSRLLAVGGFPHAAIFEDTLFCKRLLPIGQPLRLHEATLTSALRFQKNGLMRQILLNQVAKLKFYLRFENTAINQDYERGLELNGRASPLDPETPP